MTTAASTQIVPPLSPHPSPSCRAADRGVASSPWRRSSPTTPAGSTGPSGASSPAGATRSGWSSLPAEPLTVARYLAARAELRRQHRHVAAGHVGHFEGPRVGEAGNTPAGTGGARLSERMGPPTLAKPQRQSGALTADVLAVIRLTAVQPRKRGRGIETPEQAAVRARFDLALVAVLSDGGLRRSEAAVLTWGDVQRWDDGSGRITVIRSKTDAEAQGAVVAITPAAMNAPSGRHPAGGG